MGRRRTVWALIVGGLGLLAVPALQPVLALEATNLDRPAVLARIEVRPGDRFALRYEHSLYHVTTWERFTVEHGAMVLREVAAPSEAVLDYYRFPGHYGRAYAREGASLVVRGLAVAQPELVIRVDQVGRHRLVAGGREVALYEHTGDGDRVRVTVRSVPRALLWLSRL